MKKRILSLLLALCMTFVLLPTAARAAESDWPFDFSGFDTEDPEDYEKMLEEWLEAAGLGGGMFGDWEKIIEEAMKEEERLEAEEARLEAQKAAEEAARQEAARQEEAAWEASSGVVTIKAPHTVEDLNVKWKTLEPVHTEGSPYISVPEMSYFNEIATLGQVKSQVLTDGLNTLNFARYMAGLTGDVSMLTDFIVSAQYGSALLAVMDSGLTHTPQKPSGVSQYFYEQGYEGTSNSNLHMFTGSRASVAVSDSVKGYLSDLGENNRNEAGHRYYCLDPDMTGTGFGLATSRSGSLYSAMWVGYGVDLNGTGTKTTDYEAITWPAAGYHATDFYASGMQWSIRLNRNRYDVYKLGDVQVTVTGPNGTAVVPHVLSSSRALIFTPTESVRAGEKYTVEVSGLYRKDKPATLKYDVEFFKLSEPGVSDASRMAIDKVAMEAAVKEFSSVATNYTKPEDLLRCLWAETRYIDSLEWVSDPTITKATRYEKGSFKGTLKYSLNGESATCEVNMNIPEMVTDKNAYRALTAAKAMTVSASTTQEEVEKFINASLPEGSVSISGFSVKAPTDIEPGSVFYNLTVMSGSGANLGTASVIQRIPVLGRKPLESQNQTAPVDTPPAPVVPAIPSTGTAYPSTQTVNLDGRKVEFQMYALKDADGNPTNYVKVRDLALALNGTKAQFAVGWDGAVNLESGKAYAPNGSENKTPYSGEQTYTVPVNPTNVNGSASDLQAIVLTDKDGGAYTYYKLRDLGKALGFNVDWSAEKGVFIETGKPYSGN
ncbi:MAG: hypothetical protein K2F83_04480 [Oscillospiraceae bacterium]|nr:hypothetical protein [Oscillospiraceae bacterium]